MDAFCMPYGTYFVATVVGDETVTSSRIYSKLELALIEACERHYEKNDYFTSALIIEVAINQDGFIFEPTDYSRHAMFQILDRYMELHPFAYGDIITDWKRSPYRKEQE